MTSGERWAAQGHPGRIFALLASLFMSRPLFEEELSARFKSDLFKTAICSEERALLERDYVALGLVAAQARRWRHFRLILRLSVHLFIARCLVYLYVTLAGFRVMERNSRLMVEQNYTSSVYAYGCLRSDCASLFDPELGGPQSVQLLDRLPVFGLCHPALEWLYEPVQHEFGLGILCFAAFGIYALSIEFIITLARPRWCLSNHPILVFLVAPELAWRRMLERAKLHQLEVRNSYNNFRESRRLNLALPGGEFKPKSARTSPVRLARQDYGALATSATNMERLRDSMPLIRSFWWHDLLVKSSRRMALVSVVGTALLSLFSCLAGHMLALDMSKFTRELHASMRTANCSIWRDAGPQIDLASLRFGLNVYTAYSTVVVVGGWVVLWHFVTIWAISLDAWELRCWVNEILSKLVIVEPVVKNMFAWPVDGDLYRPSRPRGRHLLRRQSDEFVLVFNFRRFRRQFVLGVRSICLLLTTRKASSYVALGRRIANQQWLEENYYQLPAGPLSRMDPEAAMAELLEKFYVELRMMIEHRDEISARSSVPVMCAIAVNYVISLIAIYVVRALQDFRWDQILLVCMFIALCTTCPLVMIVNFISMNSQIHRLNPLIASVVADLTFATNSQLRHMRVVLLRLIHNFDPNIKAKGGLLQARFTYINMIQIFLWIATMSLYILK